MSQQEKPKEFWITDNGGPQFETYISLKPYTASDIHVIEYSAYESQRAELKKALDLIEELKKEIECGSQKI